MWLWSGCGCNSDFKSKHMKTWQSGFLPSAALVHLQVMDFCIPVTHSNFITGAFTSPPWICSHLPPEPAAAGPFHPTHQINANSSCTFIPPALPVTLLCRFPYKNPSLEHCRDPSPPSLHQLCSHAGGGSHGCSHQLSSLHTDSTSEPLQFPWGCWELLEAALTSLQELPALFSPPQLSKHY